MNTNGCRLSFYNSTPGMSLPPLPRDASPSHPYMMNSHDHDHYQSVPATELVTQHMLNEYETETSYEDTFDTYFSFTSPPPSSTQLSFLNNQHNMNKPLPNILNNSNNPHHYHHNINNPARLRSQSSPNIHQSIKNYQHEKSTTPSLPPISTNSVYHHYHTLYSNNNNNNQPSTSKQDKRKSNGDQDLRRPLYTFDNNHHPYSTNNNNSNNEEYYCHPTFQQKQQHNHISPSAIKVKVHHSGSIYVLVVPLSVDYKELVERIEKKMKCDSNNNVESLSNNNNDHQEIVMNGLKYQDEDGDLITISSNDDLQMGFEHRGLNNTVNFYIV